ncbi:delta-aminolevulinic acid dehydratase [Sphingorhabdus lutea]|uniref:Delta-aminolevulinic acid dehydratase n=1 Tax=Sphingorhabdus lutea TaxID=1913578 RepID=A0A1L3JDV8_9SPHN|nr:porphobilinogen synthase [Sphingorhabdus lutea]APG63289.1 delta-aminolevulinic acid dehydratase [Sphingorhabdus lutea]
MNNNISFPATRLRRSRMNNWSRNMVRETALSPSDLIWPLFIIEGENQREDIGSLPGVSRMSVDLILKSAAEAIDLGINCLALFPNTPPHLRDENGSEASNPDNLMCRATHAIKDKFGNKIGVLTDVALDPYTSHGQDGIIDKDGQILNDETASALVDQAINQANAGADIIAPSDMMDGRIGAIRRALEMNNHPNVQIMSYAAKYASAFYGPFRDAVGSGGLLKGDKKSYQMDPANSDEAMREVALDISEGADYVMVKPALSYLDIIYRVKSEFAVPVFAYQVSGEFAMVEAAAKAGMGDRDAMMMENLLSIKRAGANGILTYFAPQAAKILGK